jgi:predicted TIM-barrel fold metal-dependent hydrolase
MWEGCKEFLAFVPTPLKQCLAVQDRAISDALAALICHGVFDRFPGVQVASIENGSKWVRGLLERMAHAYGQMPQEFRRPPLETFRRHVSVAPFYEEPVDQLAELIGVGQVLFGSDYPHPEGLAEPLSFLDELKTLPPADQQRIMSTNLKALLAS